jgi:hypothetical protein
MSPNVPASVAARLLNGAKARGEEFERTLARFAAERFLYRLGQSEARGSCILKGAGLLAVWMSDPYRATRDVDLLGSGPDDAAAIRQIIEMVCAVPCPEDGLSFDLSGMTIEPIRPEEAYTGKRARFRANLGQARIAVQVDFGFGDALTDKPESIEYPTLLPGLPVSRLLAYPRVTTVAEKFEAMVNLGIRNTRMKDIHDVWALSSRFEFEGPALSDAVAACFERRRTPWSDEVPAVLTPAFYQEPIVQAHWEAYLRRGEILVLPSAQFGAIGERIIGFLGPVRKGVVTRSPLTGRWRPGGPWGEGQ